jgi:hypothetical protein
MDGKGLDEAGKSRPGEMTLGKTMQPVDQPQREDLRPTANRREKGGRKVTVE